MCAETPIEHPPSDVEIRLERSVGHAPGELDLLERRRVDASSGRARYA